eukprot:1318882-Amorphochlora_amoeboformis.AAC.1
MRNFPYMGLESTIGVENLFVVFFNNDSVRTVSKLKTIQFQGHTVTLRKRDNFNHSRCGVNVVYAHPDVDLSQSSAEPDVLEEEGKLAQFNR